MKKIINLLLCVLFCIGSACELPLYAPNPENTTTESFEILWNTLNERYSFFEYKQVNWEAVYQEYRPQIQEDMSDEAFWDVCTDMLSVLQDGHVNLRNGKDIYFYPYYLDSPGNFDRFLLEENYWGDFEITGSLINTIIDSVGYLYYGSFNAPISDNNLDYLADKFQSTKGLIIDLRNNEGGNPENGYRLGKRLADQERHIYTNKYKDGPGANDFTHPEKAFLGPEGSPLPSKVVILTNRTTYSAANFFVAMMKAFPSVTVVGDKTGGGGGAPVGWELPNGWYFNFSSSITELPDGFIIENGIDPDVKMDMSDESRQLGQDDILEAALTLF